MISIVRLMRKMKQTTLLLTIVLVSAQAFADRGAILLQKDIDLAEPAQRAIVAHNGTWELLILQTDVASDKPTKALEFMPLPSSPNVSLAPDDCFKNLQTIVTKHSVKYIVEVPRAEVGGPRGKTEGVKVVAEHELGPHHITIAEIQDAGKFRSWVIDFVKQKALGDPILSDDLDQVVADYCRRGLRFMAFDVLDVPAGTKTVAPVVYRFKCDHVYYPLKVTNLYGGTGTVEVFYVLNPWHDGNADAPKPYSFYPRKKNKGGERWIFSREAHLSTEELGTLHSEMTNLFRKAGASFFATKFEGQLEFHEDIWLRMGYSSPEYLCSRFLSLLQEEDVDSLEFLIATPFALNREKVYHDKAEALGTLKDFIKKHDLSRFRVKDRASTSGVYRNEFDKPFIEKHLKDKVWEHSILRSDKRALHFFLINRSTKELNDFKVVNFRIAPADDYSY